MNIRSEYTTKIITISVVLVLTVSGCTRVAQKFFYKNLLKYFIVNRVDHFFDLNEKQKEYLNREVGRLLAWHRKKALPEYAIDLQGVRNRLKNGLQAEDLDWLEKRIVFHRNQLYGRVIPVAVRFLQTVSGQQVSHLAGVLKEENDELKEALKKPKKERYLKKAADLEERVENFTGALSKKQKERIYSYVSQLPDTVPQWLAYRQVKQKEFITFLRKKPPAEAIRQKMREYLLFQEKLFPKKFKKDFQQAYHAMLQVILRIYPLLNAEQRKSIDSRLAEYQQMASELAGK